MTDKELETLAYALAREDAKARLKPVKPGQVTASTLNYLTFRLYREQKAFYMRRAKKELKRKKR